jgi:hypothetical protein
LSFFFLVDFELMSDSSIFFSLVRLSKTIDYSIFEAEKSLSPGEIFLSLVSIVKVVGFSPYTYYDTMMSGGFRPKLGFIWSS